MMDEALARLEPGRELWIAERGVATAGDAVRMRQGRGAAERVIIGSHDPLECAKAMACAEARARMVLIVPSALEEPVARRFTEVFESEPSWFGETRWVIATSGTTGTPKLVSHTLRSLTRTSKKDPQAGARFRWGLLYDLARFAGLQVFFNSLLSGSSLILSDPTQPLERRLEWLARNHCNALSATPTMWRKILMSTAAEKFAFRQITLGGEISDQPILDALRRKYPQARISQIYASTEAGVGFAVNDGRAGFPKSFVEHPPAGVELRLNTEGFLLVRTENRDQGYLGARESLFDEKGWINTGDLVAGESDRFVFLGRANGAINVGGNKVQPEEVERVIGSFPGVRIAAVYAKKSAITGQVVAADVVADVGNEASDWKRELAAHCALHLAGHKVPALIRIVDDIPVTQAGKLARR